ncbi:hypothetical protein GL263_17620, partial [Streptomyces durbertensis]
YCNDAERETSFSRSWAEKAAGVVADYFHDQSGGRVSVSFKVFDWYMLPMTVAEWGTEGMGVGAVVRPKVESGLDVDLASFDHILIAIDVPGASGGTTPGEYTYVAAQQFSPWLMCHELGHRFGADDAFGETADGPDRYDNPWCAMGGEGFPAVFTVPALAQPGEAGQDPAAGPGMSAPSLLATGWLDPHQHGVVRDLSSSTSVFGAGVVEELSVLKGAPGPGWTHPPRVIRYNDLLVEYRVRGSGEGWDRGLPDPGPAASGWVVVHRSDVRLKPAAVLVASMAARPGETLALGEDSPYDIHSPGPLRITVLSADSSAGTVRLNFARRAGRPLPQEPSGGGRPGIIVFVPGKGLVPLPPHSPLVKVLESVAAVHTLQEAQLVAGGDELPALTERTRQEINRLESRVHRLSTEPERPSLTRALEAVVASRQAAGRYDTRLAELENRLREVMEELSG